VSEYGSVTIASKHTVSETIDRLENALKAKDITVFARIDHSAGAASVAMPLRPTELLIFGNPRGGTPLMQSNTKSCWRGNLNAWPKSYRGSILVG